MDVDTPRKVGKSELAVTPLGFGGGTVANRRVSNEDSLATVAAAWEADVRFYDTAPWYGLGRSERRLGLALSNNAAREEYRINTKVGRSLVAEPVPDASRDTPRADGASRTPRDPRSGFRVEFDYTHDRILAQHQDSLQRLGISSVDSLTIHDLDYGYHSPEQVEQHLGQLSKDGGGGGAALEELRAAGAISAIGCGCNKEAGNRFSWEEGAHEDLCERIADVVDLDFFVIAGPYTLLDTSALARLLPLCEERGIGVIGAAPLAGGWLAAPESATTYMYGPPPPEIVERSGRMQAICKRHDVPLAAAALQFPLAHPSVAAVIPGAKSPQETTENHRLIHTEIPPAVWIELKSDGLLDPVAPTPK